jgi:hypothetical protein
MKTLSLLIVFTISLAGCSPADQPPAESSEAAVSNAADTVYTNGKIYTVNEAQPWAEAVAIKDGKFLVVGSSDEVEAVTGEGTNAVDLAGAFVMPGLIDVHGFHGMSTENRVYCELKGTFWEPTEEQILEDLRVCAEEYPADLEWFIAEGFTPSPMSKETLSAATLDMIIPDKPAYIVDEGGHNAWVSRNYPRKPIYCSYPTHNFSRAYVQMLEGLGYGNDNRANYILPVDFENYCCLYVFDLSPGEDDSSHWETYHEGSITIYAKFAEDLPVSVQMVVYSEYDNLLMIDHNRNAYHDYQL